MGLSGRNDQSGNNGHLDPAFAVGISKNIVIQWIVDLGDTFGIKGATLFPDHVSGLNGWWLILSQDPWQ